MRYTKTTNRNTSISSVFLCAGIFSFEHELCLLAPRFPRWWTNRSRSTRGIQRSIVPHDVLRHFLVRPLHSNELILSIPPAAPPRPVLPFFVIR